MSVNAARPRRAELPILRRSRVLYACMGGVFSRFFRRHMNALRIARWGLPPTDLRPGPLIVYSNHPAWWDAVVLLLLARRYFPGHAPFAPIERRMLDRYAIFARLGGFAVEPGTARGAAQFLRAARAVLAAPDRALFITAQGRFADARARPLALQGGVARLAELAPAASFLPLAIDYAFWEERGGEALVAFGPRLDGKDLLALDREARLARLEGVLTVTLDRLGHDVVDRDPARFELLLTGKAGIGGVYDGWRALRAWCRGRRFDPAHNPGLREPVPP